MNNQPIGIFDSGVGGLTVASAVQHQLPNESIVYFGDTVHLPYGDKSETAIQEYSCGITEFLLNHDAKVVLIACNSASASAYELLKQRFGQRVLVVDVINPVVDYVASQHYSKIGVIGTKRTISSGTYSEKIKRVSPSTDVVSMATPLLVPMIEEGYIFDDISNTILKAYLSDNTLNGIDALILGCTHYPIIKNQIRKIFNFDVDIIDSSGLVSLTLKNRLEELKLLSDSPDAKHDFFVSDYTPYFQKIAKMFFEGEINLQKVDIWRS